jgi:hypothetical protein
MEKIPSNIPMNANTALPSAYSESLSYYEEILRFRAILQRTIEGFNALIDKEQLDVDNLESKKEDKTFLTNNRKLSENGNFTGSWWDIEKPVHVEGGIDSVVLDMQDKIGENSALNTNDKTKIVNAINEVNSSLNDNTKHRTEWINVVQNGVDNTGNTIVTSLIQSIMDNAPDNSVIYFPKGKYLIDGQLLINHPITLMGDSHYMPYVTQTGNGMGSVIILKSGIANVTMIKNNMSGLRRFSIKNISLFSTSAVIQKTGNVATPSTPALYVQEVITDVNVNGIDAVSLDNNFNDNEIRNVYCYGFSGYAIKSSVFCIVDSCIVHRSVYGFILSTDTRITNCKTQFTCYAYTSIGNDVVSDNCRADETAYIAFTVNTGSAFNHINNFDADQVGYCVYKIGSGIGGNVDDITITGMRQSRCGQYYAQSNFLDIPDNEKWKCAMVYFNADQVNNIHIDGNLRLTGIGVDDAIPYHHDIGLFVFKGTSIQTMRFDGLINITKGNLSSIFTRSSDVFKNICYSEDSTSYYRGVIINAGVQIKANRFCNAIDSNSSMVVIDNVVYGLTVSPKWVTPYDIGNVYVYNNELYIATTLDGTGWLNLKTDTIFV